MKGRENNSQKQPFNDPSRKFTNRNDPAWSAELIKFELSKLGLSLAALARKHDVDDSAFRKVLTQHWPRLEAILADELGVSCPVDHFSHRYKNGIPIKFSAGKNNQNARKRKGQN